MCMLVFAKYSRPTLKVTGLKKGQFLLITWSITRDFKNVSMKKTSCRFILLTVWHKIFALSCDYYIICLSNLGEELCYLQKIDVSARRLTRLVCVRCIAWGYKTNVFMLSVYKALSFMHFFCFQIKHVKEVCCSNQPSLMGRLDLSVCLSVCLFT